MVSGGLERAVCSGSVRPEGNGGAGAEEQPRAPAKRSGEVLASVQRSERGQEVWRVTGWHFMVAQWRSGGNGRRRKKGVLHKEGGCSF
jgi:hypothetical protein